MEINMGNKVRSARGVMVDFDLIRIKQQIAAGSEPMSVKSRQDFIDRKLRRRVKKTQVVPAAAVEETLEVTAETPEEVVEAKVEEAAVVTEAEIDDTSAETTQDEPEEVAKPVARKVKKKS
jgi:flagella basal body P-ring formation protein FlgA